MYIEKMELIDKIIIHFSYFLPFPPPPQVPTQPPTPFSHGYCSCTVHRFEKALLPFPFLLFSIINQIFSVLNPNPSSQRVLNSKSINLPKP